MLGNAKMIERPGIALDIPMPASRTPNDQQPGEDDSGDQHRALVLLSEASDYARNEEGGDQDSGGDVPHGLKMAQLTIFDKATA